MSIIACYDSNGNLLRRLFQWDSNVTIVVNGIDTSVSTSFHFANNKSDKALIVRAAVEDGKVSAAVPNLLLQDPDPIIAYVVQTEGDDSWRRTTHAIHIPVVPRVRPDSYEYEENVEYVDWVALAEEAEALIEELRNTGAGIARWSTIEDKPFDTLDAQVFAVEDGVLTLVDGAGGSNATINDVKVHGELNSVSDLSIAGVVVEGRTYTVNQEELVASQGAEVFNNYDNVATGSYSHAEGANTKATGNWGSHAEGEGGLASGSRSHTEGSYTKATGDYGAHAEGDGSEASGEASHAEGANTKATAQNAHAEGRSTEATGLQSHAEGFMSKSQGFVSHAEGQETVSSGSRAHAEGYKSSATASQSHAEGTETSATSPDAHAEGYKTVASGAQSHSQGYESVASGDQSHASGSFTVAASNNQTVIGRANNIDSANTYAFIIGNGTTNDNRSNAFSVTWDGDVVSATGKSLSEANFTTTEKNKLSGMDASLANVIDNSAKNLIRPVPTEHYGVTITVDENGQMILNGANAGTSNQIYRMSMVYLEAGVHYTLVDDALSDGEYYVHLRDSDSLSTQGEHFMNTLGTTCKDFTVETSRYYLVAVRIPASSTYDNKILRPMLCRKSDYDFSQKFVPYFTPNNEIRAMVSNMDNVVSANTINIATNTSAIADASHAVSVHSDTLGTKRVNLLEILEKTYNKNGITVKCNDDGSITLDGSNTSSGAFVIVYNLRQGYTTSSSYENNRLLDNGEYILSGCTPNCRIQVFGATEENTVGSQIISAPADGSAATFTITDTHKFVYTRLYIAVGASFSNETIYPMIRKSDVTDDTWVSAKGSLQFQIDSLKKLITENILNGSW